ncbi:MAG: hypothetical protein IKP72_08430 [Clostridia bacterium]|nr:hypothetical protein [Clostridia bacterium]
MAAVAFAVSSSIILKERRPIKRRPTLLGFSRAAPCFSVLRLDFSKRNCYNDAAEKQKKMKAGKIQKRA